jgi:hypothetical protein
MRRALLALAMLLAASVIATGTALGGTYQVGACAAPTPLIDNSWQPFNNNPTYLETSANCGSTDVTGGSLATSGLAAGDVLQLTTNVPAGATAGWQFIVPLGDSISAVSLDRDLYEQGEGWVPQIVDAGGNVLAGEACSFNASNGGCEVSGEAVHTGLDTTSLAIELVCNPVPYQLTACGNGFSEHDARVELNSATVTVTDNQAPQITSTSGSLFTGALVRGALSGTIDGSDSSGVQYARVYVDSAQVAQQALTCDFTRPAPCPASSSSQFSLDTTALSGGPHQIQAAVVDAAGNQTLGSPVQVTVDNTSPSAPTGLQVNGKAAGTWINQPATITWTNPSEPQGNPISQVNWIACPGAETSIPASGCDAPQHQASPLSSLTFNPAQDPKFAGQPQALYTVFVWLQDALGNSTPANSAAISFGYQTSPPPPPTSIKASGAGPYTITLGAPAHLAPLTATNWLACKGPANCTPAQTSPGLSFRFDPNHTPQFQSRPYGTYTIRAWLQDAAGNASPADSATLTITHSKPGKASPQLHILSVTRTKRALRVRGAAANTLSGHVTIIVHYTLGARSNSVQKTVRVAHGKWTAVLGLPGGARSTRVTVVHRSTTHWLAQTVTRYVHHHRAGTLMGRAG